MRHCIAVEFYDAEDIKCQRIVPTLDELIDKYGESVTFLAVDVHHYKSRLRDMVKDMKIVETPTFKFLKGGTEVAPDVVGYAPDVLSGTVATLATADVVAANADMLSGV